MGQNGYMEIARNVWNTTTILMNGIRDIKGIKLITKSDMTCIAIVSDDKRVNVLAVADVMEEYGWKIERQQLPDSLHVSYYLFHFFLFGYWLSFIYLQYLPLLIIFFLPIYYLDH
jgi:glutamate/tyrosine decarboxylase-like PLP-dependent enzyme